MSATSTAWAEGPVMRLSVNGLTATTRRKKASRSTGSGAGVESFMGTSRVGGVQLWGEPRIFPLSPRGRGEIRSCWYPLPYRLDGTLAHLFRSRKRGREAVRRPDWCFCGFGNYGRNRRVQFVNATRRMKSRQYILDSHRDSGDTE